MAIETLSVKYTTANLQLTNVDFVAELIAGLSGGVTSLVYRGTNESSGLPSGVASLIMGTASLVNPDNIVGEMWDSQGSGWTFTILITQIAPSITWKKIESGSGGEAGGTVVSSTELFSKSVNGEVTIPNSSIRGDASSFTTQITAVDGDLTLAQFVSTDGINSVWRTIGFPPSGGSGESIYSDVTSQFTFSPEVSDARVWLRTVGGVRKDIEIDIENSGDGTSDLTITPAVEYGAKNEFTGMKAIQVAGKDTSSGSAGLFDLTITAETSSAQTIITVPSQVQSTVIKYAIVQPA